MTEIPTAPDKLILTFFMTYKLYGKNQMSGRINGTQEDADIYKRVLESTPGVTDIKIEWER